MSSPSSPLARFFTRLFGLKGPRERISEDVYTALHAQPVQSYTLLPVVRCNALGQITPTDEFNLIIKINELSNPRTIDPYGVTSSMSCSTFIIVPAELDSDGDVVVDYKHSRGDNTYVTSVAVDTGSSKMDLPLTRKVDLYTAKLAHKTHSLCTFTPL
jgi:hypothetical protein